MKVYTPFITFPNQLVATINKKTKERFLMVNINDIREAAKDLTPASLKLYLYFVENQDGYTFHLSPKDFMQSYNVSESTYRRSKEELIRKGYIVQNDKEITFYANKNDSLQDYTFYKTKINDLIKNLITQGMSEQEIKEKIAQKRLKELEGKAQILAAKELFKEFQKILEDKIKNKEYL